MAREILDLDDPLDETPQPVAVALQMLEIEAPVREGDAGNARREPFHGGCNRTGIQHVLAHVGTVIHSRDHEVRLLGDQGAQAEEHAVGGGAIDLKRAVGPADGA